jgi:4-alpha-glucanotransferase
VDAAPDGLSLARELWPVLADIVEWHLRGTRYRIGVDPADGLLHAGEPGVQLTWMDAKVGDWVVTPRIGKPVEISALWYAALRTTARIARIAGWDPSRFDRLADQTRRGFQAFVRPDGLGLYDVLTADGPDPSIRCNQILAVSETPDLLDAGEARAVVQTVQRDLLTPVGLRTLAPSDPAYRPRYEGGPLERDSAYHQGAAWPWLLGPFAEAHYRVYGDAEQARSYLRPMAERLADDCIGSIAEVYDGDPPHRPNGCPAQAWSVGEILRVWRWLGGAQPGGDRRSPGR